MSFCVAAGQHHAGHSRRACNANSGCGHHPHTAFGVQALLDEWRDELSRKPLGMSEADACAILEIAPDADGHVAEEDLKQVGHDHRTWCVH